jgi:hypothetical protein
MAKQTFTVGQVLTAAQLTSLQQTAMGGGAASAKTASYTLVAADAGTTISMTSTSATTVTVNTGLFAAGDTVFIQNLGSGNLTITAGSATVATAGSLILPQNDAGILYFVSTSSSVFYDFIQVGAASPLTTKGDLYTFSTSDARLGVGANNTILTADSAEATGLKWATSSSGGMTLISETVASALSSLSLSSIPATYTDLLLEFTGIEHSSSGAAFRIRFNNDSGSNYTGLNFYTNSPSTLTLEAFNSTSISYLVAWGEGVNRGLAFDDLRGYLKISNYASTTKLKMYEYSAQWFGNNGDNYKSIVPSQMRYESTSAITSIDIVRVSASGTFSNKTNTSIRLYGLK